SELLTSSFAVWSLPFDVVRLVWMSFACMKTSSNSLMPVAVISGGAVSFAKAAVSKTALARRPTSRTAILMVSGSWLDGRLGNEVRENGRAPGGAEAGG